MTDCICNTRYFGKVKPFCGHSGNDKFVRLNVWHRERCVAFYLAVYHSPPSPLPALLRALWTLCSVSLWVIFLPVYCRSLPLLGLCSSAQPCPFTSQRMLITVTLNHQASLSSAIHTPPQPTPFWVQQGVKWNSLHSIIDLVTFLVWIQWRSMITQDTRTFCGLDFYSS